MKPLAIVGAVYQHKKTGGKYLVLHRAWLEWEPETEVVIYQLNGQPDSKIWVRSNDEFMDGRFESVFVPEAKSA